MRSFFTKTSCKLGRYSPKSQCIQTDTLAKLKEDKCHLRDNSTEKSKVVDHLIVFNNTKILVRDRRFCTKLYREAM